MRKVRKVGNQQHLSTILYIHVYVLMYIHTYIHTHILSIYTGVNYEVMTDVDCENETHRHTVSLNKKPNV